MNKCVLLVVHGQQEYDLGFDPGLEVEVSSDKTDDGMVDAIERLGIYIGEFQVIAYVGFADEDACSEAMFLND